MTKEDVRKWVVYCPICMEWLGALNMHELQRGKVNKPVFAHKAGLHSDRDLEALDNGMQ